MERLAAPRGARLEFNDIGYLERKNDYQASLALTYRTLDPWWHTRETATALQVNVRRSLAGLTLWNEVKLVPQFGATNFWWFYFGTGYSSLAS